MAISGPADRPTVPGFRGLRRQRVRGHLVRRLGHSVGLDQRRAERRLELLDHLRRHRRRRRAHEAQRMARDRLGVVLRARDDRLVHRRHGRVPGRLGLVHPREEPERVEAGRAEHAGPGRDRRQHAGDQAVDVEQRHDVEADVGRRERQRGADVARPRRTGWPARAARSSAARWCPRCAAPSRCRQCSNSRRSSPPRAARRPRAARAGSCPPARRRRRSGRRSERRAARRPRSPAICCRGRRSAAWRSSR